MTNKRRAALAALLLFLTSADFQATKEDNTEAW